jgi:uncharacterized protein YnzC (UPF0291/DUF896 family)
MRITKSNTNPELAIWERVFIPDPRTLTADQARYLLDARFAQADLNRINELSIKADDGTLTTDEHTELENYLHVGHVLSILKAKLRGKLKKTAS